MEFGICNLSVVPVRSEPSEKSEMVTQALFGELLVKEDKYGSWHKIRLLYDNYEGWIDHRQYLFLSEDEFKKIEKGSSCLTLDLVQVIKDINSESLYPVILGSTLPQFSEGKFSIKESTYSYEGLIARPEPSTSKIIEYVYLYLNAPYLWGGKTPFGIDCSGLAQMVYKLAGISLYRDTNQQYEQGEIIHLISEALPGDLAFFDNEESEINHVGIILPENKIIHASGKVKTDDLDHQGIYDHDTDKYTHKLRLIKRII